MSMKKLVEAECGGANALVGLSSHFIQDRAFKDEGFHTFSDPISANADQMAHEFLEETSHTTQPFRMDTLLAEMRELEAPAAPVTSASVSQLTAEGDVQEWAQQYLDSGKHFVVNTKDSEIWTSDIDGMDGGESSLGFGPRWANEYIQRTQELMLDEAPTLADLSNSEEYEEKFDALKETAGEILTNTSNDQRFTFSKFMKFMKQINEGEVTIDSAGNVQNSEDMVDSSSKAEHWSLEYEHDQQPAAQWTEEYFKAEGDEAARNPNDPFNKQLWEKLTEQWKNISIGGNAPESTQWESEYLDQYAGLSQYSYSSDNPMENVSNPLEEGKKLRESGNLPGAVLCFEAATKQEPENPLAWQLLGITQAENEQDAYAIPALVQCLKLQPDNLTALMALSACYTNENYQNQACLALKEWLRMNPKYSDMIPKDDSEKFSMPNVSSFLTREVYDEVKNAFLAAARRNPQDLDPDVQCGLGVLFNIASEHDLAADCFKAALQARPNDAALWNRLGATLANGDRSEEAVDAYRSALQLQPGFIRARYNLGITCVHLLAHREAAEHFLTALKQQSNGQNLQSAFKKSAMSDTIWNTLRLVMNLLDRNDLIRDVYLRNLDKLTKEFGIE